jgi:hypothetical protein
MVESLQECRKNESLILEDIWTNPILQSQMASYHNKLTKVTLPPDSAYNNPEDEVQMNFSKDVAYDDVSIKRKY